MSKARGRHWFLWLSTAVAAVVAGCGPPSPPRPPLAAVPQTQSRPGGENCALGMESAARLNGRSLATLAIADFHHPEIGWETYAPLIAHEIDTACVAASPAFARDLATWQHGHGLAPTGVLDEVTLEALKRIWDSRRPFVAISAKACPSPPDPSRLTAVPPEISYGGKAMLLRAGALTAYERMLRAARSESQAVSADRRLMTLFSAYRDPGQDDARCLVEGNCQGVVRANCSAHRTGLAIDLNLGAAPGQGPDSSDDANRLYISRGPAYRWMVANAGRFGFVNYPFEPWHWEWTGEAP